MSEPGIHNHRSGAMDSPMRNCASEACTPTGYRRLEHIPE
jgi:hypothetical protein